MLFAKSAFVLSFLALGNIAAAAGTKACLLEALSTEPSPGDLKAVCVDKVQTRIESLCSGDDKQDALKQFSSSSGFVTATATSTPGSDSSSSSPTSGSDSSSNSGSGSGSEPNPSSTSSSGVPLHTSNAGSSDRHIPAAAFAAVVFVGFAATL
ncbi:hypothetical protein BDV38DRAFT_105345 [Aspergillus pseudotamarii]|uniref:GPI anchored cell wall protein n=1 Tax=Aspergillus pseudotamarii TaxID=132259 RepID=A0A5N6SQE0_ASPPS|nr:uncharacterized protein BDV38DRAFT_105345 [Aspergillus pseudotamarii]KAE8136912.1 hypothetical protein BDV38DRAFT_105345 [Aspergillus pseudotamarii]